MCHLSSPTAGQGGGRPARLPARLPGTPPTSGGPRQLAPSAAVSLLSLPGVCGADGSEHRRRLEPLPALPHGAWQRLLARRAAPLPLHLRAARRAASRQRDAPRAEALLLSPLAALWGSERVLSVLPLLSGKLRDACAPPLPPPRAAADQPFADIAGNVTLLLPDLPSGPWQARSRRRRCRDSSQGAGGRRTGLTRRPAGGGEGRRNVEGGGGRV